MAEFVDAPMRVPLSEIARVFLRLGVVSFGGPAAHVALMEEEIVRPRRWLTGKTFLDLLGAANLIPGPNSTELAIHVGYARAGWPGLLVAGACLILPAAVIVAALAWGYVRYGSLPAISGILAGVTPVVIAIVAQAIWNLGRSVLASRRDRGETRVRGGGDARRERARDPRRRGSRDVGAGDIARGEGQDAIGGGGSDHRSVIRGGRGPRAVP